MTVHTYIFKNVNLQQLKRLFYKFQYKQNEVNGYYLEYSYVISIDSYDVHESRKDDMWNIVDANSGDKLGTIMYEEMPVGHIVQFIFEENERILLFIDEIIATAVGYGIEPEKEIDKSASGAHWEKYIRSEWEARAIRLWNQGMSDSDISAELGRKGYGKVSPGTVRNRITVVRNLLRKEGRAELIIYHRSHELKTKN